MYKPTQEQRAIYVSRYKFGGLREFILERDGYKCSRCGMTQEEHKNRWGTSLAVDHIDGRGKNVPKEQKNNNPNNLQTLCCSCHGKKDIYHHPKFRKPKPQWKNVISAGILAAVYKSGGPRKTNMLIHSLAEGQELTLCNRINRDHLADGLDINTRPTCPVCLRRDPRFLYQ